MALAPVEWAARMDEMRAEISEALDRYTSERPGCPDRLRRAMRYSLLAPGKRLRPILVLLAAEACGAAWRTAIPAAAAVEMIHAYSLIHDDLPAMDDDTLRRGRPTCHIAFDEATAILAGDALIPLAFEVLASELEPAECGLACCRELAVAAGAGGLVGGQCDDLAGQGGGRSLERLEAIHLRKTGALLRVALRLGGRVAGAHPDRLDLLDQFGRHLGLAFQITDDLLDCSSSAEQLGKTTGKDASQEKLTYPALLGIEASRQRAAALIDEAITCLRPLEPDSRPLQQLARFVLERDH